MNTLSKPALHIHSFIRKSKNLSSKIILM